MSMNERRVSLSLDDIAARLKHHQDRLDALDRAFDAGEDDGTGEAMVWEVASMNAICSVLGSEEVDRIRERVHRTWPRRRAIQVLRATGLSEDDARDYPAAS